MNQSTNCILMVRPFSFRVNEETAVNNYFHDTFTIQDNINILAKAEFDEAVCRIKEMGVQVICIQDKGIHDTPDSLFPNNVISFHHNLAILYPMFAHNRQREIYLNHLGEIEKHGLYFKNVKDYTPYAEQEMYLEGTGVLVLDRQHKIAYCSLSERAHESLVHIFCEDNNFRPHIFHATQRIKNNNLPIYHTNVMMALGTDFCVICLDSILNANEKQNMIDSLLETNKKIIAISEAQMNHFCGNIVELKNKENQTLIAMSEQAYKAFTRISASRFSWIREDYTYSFVYY